MFATLFRPNNLSQKMMRVILSIYLGVTFIVTPIQFITEYLKTQDSIYTELQQLEETVRDSISVSLWQFNQNQVSVLVDGLLKMPIIDGVDVLDQDAQPLVSIRSYAPSAAPLSIFETTSALSWTTNGETLPLGTLVIYSSSGVVLSRVWFGFSLILITAIIKLSVLYWLFVWAFDRYLAKPLNELMSQVDKVELKAGSNMQIKLSTNENNELSRLQNHMNKMLSTIELDRQRSMEDEKTKRAWLEDEVAKRTKALEELNKKLKNLAKQDSLTGILNRGGFFEAAQYLFILSQRQKAPTTFVLMDLDYFKNINDTHGHFTGDQVLIHFADTIQKFLRKSDLFGRVGGEEFALFLPDTDTEGALQLADKICKVISRSTLEVDGKTVIYTVSLGVEPSQSGDDSIDEIFKRADLKLYSAKNKGRNRVEI